MEDDFLKLSWEEIILLLKKNAPTLFSSYKNKQILKLREKLLMLRKRFKEEWSKETKETIKKEGIEIRKKLEFLEKL